MTAILLDTPAPADQRIRELHAWIATRADGSEGIVSADMVLPGVGLPHTPLISSKRHLAEAMAPKAAEAQALSLLSGHPVTLRLASFGLDADDGAA